MIKSAFRNISSEISYGLWVKDLLLHSVLRGLDIWCHRYLFYRADFQNQLRSMDRLALISPGHLLDQLCKEETFCLKDGRALKNVWDCILGCQQIFRMRTKSLH